MQQTFFSVVRLLLVVEKSRDSKSLNPQANLGARLGTLSQKIHMNPLQNANLRRDIFIQKQAFQLISWKCCRVRVRGLMLTGVRSYFIEIYLNLDETLLMDYA